MPMEETNTLAGNCMLVVGGGIGGMATAIAFARSGWSVDLIDLDPDWRVYGAGITITGPTLRAYRRLGLLDAVAAQGSITNRAKIFRYDGELLRELVEPVIEEGLPATGGIMRPVLHRIMQAEVRRQAVSVRLGLTVSALENTGEGVDVTFSNGGRGRYDLVVGADSIASSIRRLAFPLMVPPTETGQGCWRISIRKPPQLETVEFYLGGNNPCGITACAPDMVYMWMLTPHEERDRFMSDQELFEGLRALLHGFGGSAGWIRDTMSLSDWINYRPLCAAIQPLPWCTGRVVLLGDAVHATTPHLASGAGMAVESALVLAEEVTTSTTIEAGLAAYETRRFDRCRDVVKTSVRMGELQLNHAPSQEFTSLLEGALHRLNQPF